MTAINPPVFIQPPATRFAFKRKEVVFPKATAPRCCTIKEWRVIESEIRALKEVTRFFLN